MSGMKETLINEFQNFPKELLTDTRQMIQDHIDEAANKVLVDSIRKATLALKEAEISDEQVVALLQKYWDLRRSEALELVEEVRELRQQE